MAKIMAIDYGGKRCGIAVTDDLQMIASGLTTVHSKDLVTFIEEYVSQNKVEIVLLGKATGLNYQATDSTQMIEDFARHFVKKFPNITLERLDERFTSKLASQALIMGGANKKQRANKGLVDKLSATILLQDFLQWHR